MKTKSIAIPAGLPAGRDIFGALAAALGCELCVYEPALIGRWNAGEDGALAEIFSGHPVLLVTPTNIKLNARLLRVADGRVGALASVSTGTDHVDFAALEESGIPFFHAPGVNARSVAEYVISALPLYFDADRLLAGEIRAGIIGYGHVGRALGSMLRELGMDFRFYDPLIEPEEGFSPLSETLQADFISFHVPLTRAGEHATLGMVNDSYLAPVRPGSLIINTARGKIMSEESYKRVTRDFPTLMDVFPEEPPTGEMLERAACVSPHIAGYNYSARAGGSRATALAYASFVGLPLETIPPLPEVRYDHYVIDFLSSESERLKNDPASFAARRSHYPDRGDFSACPGEKYRAALDPFRWKVLETFAGTAVENIRSPA